MQSTDIFFYFFMKNLGCVCLTVCLTLSLTMPVPARQRHGSVWQMDTGLERHRINGVGHLSKWPNTNLEAAVAKFWFKFVFGKKLLMIAQIVDCQIVWKKKDCLARFCLVAANCKLLLDPCLAVEWRKRKKCFEKINDGDVEWIGVRWALVQCELVLWRLTEVLPCYHGAHCA